MVVLPSFSLDKRARCVYGRRRAIHKARVWSKVKRRETCVWLYFRRRYRLERESKTILQKENEIGEIGKLVTSMGRKCKKFSLFSLSLSAIINSQPGSQ